jgi:spore maturation protein CgeB
VEALTTLYVGQLWKGSTAVDRMRSLSDLGVRVIPFDTTPYLRRGPLLLRSIANRYYLGTVVNRLNEDLLAFADRNPDYRCVWIDKGTWIWPATLRHLKRNKPVRLVHFTPDSQLVAVNQSRHFRKSIPIYDVLFTTKPFEMEKHTELGARNVHLTFQSYDQARFLPAAPSAEDLRRFGSDITFIGHYEPHYARCVRALADRGLRIRVWGQNWEGYRRWHPWAGKIVAGDGVWGPDYPAALRCAKIALGLLIKRVRETTTTRTFEIPACGVFLLAERSEEHLALFEEGKEAEFFGCQEELIDKARYYLDHPDARQRIAQAGYERCVKSGYSTRARLEWMLERVRECPA